jgi:hypothetical protein
VSSRSFAHASHCRPVDSNCAVAPSSVAAWPSARMSAGLPKMPCSDQNQRMLLVDSGIEAGRAHEGHAVLDDDLFPGLQVFSA